MYASKLPPGARSAPLVGVHANCERIIMWMCAKRTRLNPWWAELSLVFVIYVMIFSTVNLYSQLFDHSMTIHDP